MSWTRVHVGRRSYSLLLGVAVVISAGYLARVAFGTFRADQSSVISYTVQRTERGFDKAGTLKYTVPYVDAVRSDGSVMRRTGHQREIDFANGDRVRTNERLARVSTYLNMNAGRAPVQRASQASCFTQDDRRAGWSLGAEETVAGHRTVRMTYTGGGRNLTIWRALDAGCAQVRLRFEHETGVTEQNLDSLVLGEPDAELFEVPPSYGEVPPSQLVPCEGDTCKALRDTVRTGIDRAYYALRSNAH